MRAIKTAILGHLLTAVGMGKQPQNMIEMTSPRRGMTGVTMTPPRRKRRSTGIAHLANPGSWSYFRNRRSNSDVGSGYLGPRRRKIREKWKETAVDSVAPSYTRVIPGGALHLTVVPGKLRCHVFRVPDEGNVTYLGTSNRPIKAMVAAEDRGWAA